MNTNNLISVLSRIAPLAQGNKIVPMTENLKLSFSDNKLTASATDLQTFVTVTDYCEQLSGTEFCVNASQFMNILKGFADKEIELLHDDNTLTVKSGRSKYKIPTEPTTDFPKQPETATESIAIDSDVIKSAINNIIFAVSRDELRVSMTGVFFDENNVVATDAHKLVKYSLLENIGKFIIPEKSAKFITTAIYGNVDVSFNGTQLNIKGDDFNISTRTIDERYPDYNAVIPTSFNSTLKVDKSELIEIVQRLLLTANKQSNVIRFDLGSECFASSSDTDYNTEGKEQFDANFEGDDLTIGFNGNFLLSALKTINEDVITLKLIAQNRAGVIECKDKIILIMPVNINS